MDVVDEREENLETGRRRWGQMENIRWHLKETGTECVYDWVFLIGPRTLGSLLELPGRKESWNWKEEEKAYLTEQIRQAAARVKDGGRLALALPNRNGLKYWAGAAPEEEEASMNLSELREVFGSMGGRTEFYYPLPDYKLPTAIYSDRYLPVQGELPSLYAEYEKPRYRLFSEEAAYDAVCQAGGFPQFANSFFVIWEKL